MNAELRTHIEKKLTEIWEQVLGIHHVDIHDDFFDLGGDSITVVEVLSRLQKAFQVKLPARSFFDTPNIGAIAASIYNILGE